MSSREAYYIWDNVFGAEVMDGLEDMDWEEIHLRKFKCCIDTPFQNGGQITDIFFRVISILAKIWKTTFPKEFSMKFGLK